MKTFGLAAQIIPPGAQAIACELQHPAGDYMPGGYTLAILPSRRFVLVDLHGAVRAVDQKWAQSIAEEMWWTWV